ncbi:uncharacterized protein LOC141673995 [Apium graveolens]|uniref:uncharacterized protein LOC141673995 n=1 Tax=Apium graveolens TaxID=4045 RepID=UPI003D7A88E2
MGYYWPTLRHDAMEYVKKCDACQRHAPIIYQPSELLHATMLSWPFMKWGMGIIGKMPPTPGQKMFMLVMTDYVSKWIEAEAFRKVKNRTTPKTTIGQTPSSLVYGTEAVLSTEVMMPTIRYGLSTYNANKHEMMHDIDTINESREMEKIRMAIYQQKVAKSYNKNVHVRTLQVGDMVLRKVFQNMMDMLVGKFVETWEGPYLIVAVVGCGAYQLSTMDGVQIPRMST